MDANNKAIEAAARAVNEDWDNLKDKGIRLAIMRRAIAAYEAALWQPIETAPRDGTVIDIWIVPPTNAGPRDFPIYIGAHAHRITDATPCYRTAWESCGRTITGRRFYDDDGDQCLDPDDTSERATRATHWRPLPQPPGGEG